ncbi:MAG: DUF2752 domain-containing protein [Treponema sp.]|nr:DUF2752 domain-containing protein [Treponema sp.]
MTCIIRELFHFPCPTCGVTRALLSLMKGDVQKYLYYNAAAVPLLIATILMVLGTKKRITICTIISCTILIINIPYYFFRMIVGIIP